VQYLEPIDAKVFEACPGLKVVGRTGIGVDQISVPDATAHNVVVTNVPGYCVEEVSDHAMALMLSCVRRTALYTQAVKSGSWDWKIGQPITRIRGLTLGLVGFGGIPRAILPKARGFGMDVICADPYLKPEIAQAEGVELVALVDLLARADLISVHCPLTDETRAMFNADLFAKMKPSAFFVNTARGGIVDLDALIEALKTKQIAGAGLDVLPQEPPADLAALEQLDNLVLSPHVAWYSEDSIIELQTRIGRNVALVCRGEMPDAVVNREVLDKRPLQ
jgi:D-3-phosphoglycerate dehydrogenase